MIPRLATAVTAGLLVLRANVSLAAVLTVDDDGHDCPNAAYRTIGGALAAAQPGNQVNVCAGTYAEQVVIANTVRLTGTGNVVIRPTALPASRASALGGRPITAGIIVDAPSALISGFQVDMSASGVTDCGTILAGIYFRGASGVVINSTVTGARVPGQPACDSGVGVYVESGQTSSAKVTLENDQITNCQKGGVVANGAGTAVKIRGGEIAGSGPSPAVENGIQIALGARARVSQVKVHGQMTTATGKTATGVLTYQARRATMRGTSISSGQSGVFVVGRALLVRNDLKNLTDGVVLMGDLSKLIANTFDGASASGIFVNGSRNIVRLGSMAHMPVGIWAYAGQGNHFSGVTFDPSVPITEQGASGGVRDLTAASAAPLLPPNVSRCRTAADCNDGTTCTVASCDTTTGVCSFMSNCDDGNPCTDDLCSGTACVHLSNTAPCDDGNACTVNDTCANGACVGGTLISCDDGNPCTQDACSPTLGCVHLPITGCTTTTISASTTTTTTLPGACNPPCTPPATCVGGTCQ